VSATYTYSCAPEGPATRLRLVAQCQIDGPLKLLGPLLRMAMRRPDRVWGFVGVSSPMGVDHPPAKTDAIEFTRSLADSGQGIEDAALSASFREPALAAPKRSSAATMMLLQIASSPTSAIRPATRPCGDRIRSERMLVSSR